MSINVIVQLEDPDEVSTHVGECSICKMQRPIKRQICWGCACDARRKIEAYQWSNHIERFKHNLILNGASETITDEQVKQSCGFIESFQIYALGWAMCESASRELKKNMRIANTRGD